VINPSAIAASDEIIESSLIIPAWCFC